MYLLYNNAKKESLGLRCVTDKVLPLDMLLSKQKVRKRVRCTIKEERKIKIQTV